MKSVVWMEGARWDRGKDFWASRGQSRVDGRYPLGLGLRLGLAKVRDTHQSTLT